jgi:hypothetical protein
MWHTAARSAHKNVEFISMESLSRGEQSAPEDIGVVIVDEAHHFRNPRTKRYSSLAKIAARRPVILLTATPVHNRRNDLTALLALFFGSASSSITRAELGRLIIRRESNGVGISGSIPLIEPPMWLDVVHDGEIPQSLLNLPPPLPPRDGGDGGALVIHSLLRQWASSNAALERALVRRLQRSFALISALESGTYPSQGELSAWISAEDSVQLAFAELVATEASSGPTLLPIVQRHRDAISSLLTEVRLNTRVDQERANLIRTIRSRHSGTSVVAFSQYADTIDALFRDLSRDGGVAALTGDGATVSGGRISRQDAIGRFAPVASGVRAPRKAEAVTLLLTTDLLSEGVNLQDAGVVMHLDLPWTPARMEQRLGRIARMGSPHDRVFSYVIRPPASTETLIHLEQVLHDKVRQSSQVVDVFPSLSRAGGNNADNTPRLSESIRSLLVEWSRDVDPIDDHHLIWAAVSSPVAGCLALCENDTGLRLVAVNAESVSDDPTCVVASMHCCAGVELQVDRSTLENSLSQIERHFAGRQVTGGASSVDTAHARRAGLKRISRFISSARPHERARVASLASGARSALLSQIGAHDEARLDALSRETMTDDKWMEQVSQFGRATNASTQIKVIAAILLVAQ